MVLQVLREKEETVEELKQQLQQVKEERDYYKAQLEESISNHQQMMLLCINYMKTGDEDNSNLTNEIKDFREELKTKLEREFLRIFPDSQIPDFLERVRNKLL